MLERESTTARKIAQCGESVDSTFRVQICTHVLMTAHLSSLGYETHHVRSASAAHQFNACQLLLPRTHFHLSDLLQRRATVHMGSFRAHALVESTTGDAPIGRRSTVCSSGAHRDGGSTAMTVKRLVSSRIVRIRLVPRPSRGVGSARRLSLTALASRMWRRYGRKLVGMPKGFFKLMADFRSDVCRYWDFSNCR